MRGAQPSLNAPAATVRYTVQPGDTLGTVAKRFYNDASRFPLIVAANRFSDPDKLTVGQEIVIPEAALAAVNLTPPFRSSVQAGVPPVANPTARLNEQRLSQLHPILAIRARCMVELCAYAGIAVLVTQGLRTWEEQDALYAKGRTVPPLGKIVTKAKGGYSYHNFGLAFDIVVLDAVGKADWNTAHPSWQRAAELGKSLGLEWGGDWKTFKDVPHFQYIDGLTTAECRELYPSGLQAIWDQVT